VSWLVVRWCDEPDAPKANRLLILAAYLIGLGYTNHPAGCSSARRWPPACCSASRRRCSTGGCS
jgi:hypothetical protein